MNYSDFKLHGISPIYDQVIFIRCHLCQLIIKLPHLVEHLQKRHKITNDANEATLSQLIINEQQNLALNEEKSLSGTKNGKKLSARASKHETIDSNGQVTKPVGAAKGAGKSAGVTRKQSGKSSNKAKNEKNGLHELKKEASLPMLSRILDDSSVDGLKTNNCTSNESSNTNGSSAPGLHHVQTCPSLSSCLDLPNHEQKLDESNDSSSNQMRFKYVVEKIKTKLNGTLAKPETSDAVNHDISAATVDKNNSEIYHFSSSSQAFKTPTFNASDNTQQLISKNELGSPLIHKKNKNSKGVRDDAHNMLCASEPPLLGDNLNHEHLQSMSHVESAGSPFKYNENMVDSSRLFNDDHKLNSVKFGSSSNGASSDSFNKANHSSNVSKTSKIFDPNKHCGVVVEEVDSLNGGKILREPCTRSLTCKKHSINLRRQVTGRSKSFNELFKEYRDEKLSNNQLVNTNKPINDAQSSASLISSANSTPCKTSERKLSNSFNFPGMSNYHPEQEQPSQAMPVLSNIQDLSDTKVQASHNIKNNYQNLSTNNNNNNNNINTSMELNKLINGFDFINYQNMAQSLYQPDQEHYMKNNSCLPQDQYQMHHQQKFTKLLAQQDQQYNQSVNHNQPSVTQDQTIETQSSSIYKPFLASGPLSHHSPINQRYKNTNSFQSPSAVTNSPARPLNFDEISQQMNLNYLNKMLVKHHPRPSAVTSFNARSTDNGGGYTLWDRRQDNLRLLLSNAFSQTDNFLNKNVSFTSSIEPGLTQSPVSNFSLTPNKSNFKYENHVQESPQRSLNKQEKQKNRSQTKPSYNNSLSNSQSSSSVVNHSNNPHKTPAKQKISSNSKKRNTSSSDFTQHLQQNYNGIAPAYPVPAKLSKPDTESISAFAHLTNNNPDIHMSQSLDLNNKFTSRTSQNEFQINSNEKYMSSTNSLANYSNQFVNDDSSKVYMGYDNNKKSTKNAEKSDHQPTKKTPNKKTNNELFQSYDFLKYSSEKKTENGIVEANNGNNSRHALKSISLSPSPSSSSSASNSSSIVNNNAILFNTAN